MAFIDLTQLAVCWNTYSYNMIVMEILRIKMRIVQICVSLCEDKNNFRPDITSSFHPIVCEVIRLPFIQIAQILFCVL